MNKDEEMRQSDNSLNINPRYIDSQIESSNIFKNSSTSILENYTYIRKSTVNDDRFNSEFIFISRTNRSRFEDWFWLGSHDICIQHAYASERPCAIKNIRCVFSLRIFLLLSQIAVFAYTVYHEQYVKLSFGKLIYQL